MGLNSRATYRAAVERELHDRLAAESDAPGLAHPVASIALLCLQCRALNDGDAHFCTRCGARFNALVVVPPATASTKGSAAR